MKVQKTNNKPEEEPEEESIIVKQPSQNQITIGDITLISNNNLANMQKQMKSLLKDRTIKSYLGFHNKNLITKIPTGFG